MQNRPVTRLTILYDEWYHLVTNIFLARTINRTKSYSLQQYYIKYNNVVRKIISVTFKTPFSPNSLIRFRTKDVFALNSSITVFHFRKWINKSSTMILICTPLYDTITILWQSLRMSWKKHIICYFLFYFNNSRFLELKEEWAVGKSSRFSFLGFTWVRNENRILRVYKI